MEEQKDIFAMLDLLTQPGFCVKENQIVKTNPAAQGLLLSPGMGVQELLLTGQEEYAAFQEGCLYLTLSLQGQPFGASVFSMDGTDVFLLEEDAEQPELRSLSLAARELRSPLSSAMTAAGQLLATQEDPQAREQMARLNRGLYQLLRIVGNMSDAACPPARPETQNIAAVLDEIFEKARTLLEHTGLRLTYEPLNESVYCLTDREQLERAVLNILSNAAKFTPKGGTIRASLRRRGRMLRLSIQDSGSGIAESILGSIHRRYLRQPAIEDSRFGLGLGMVLIRACAASHGGTVLIDRCEGGGTRVTMTFAIRQKGETVLHSPVLRMDYTGGYDHSLVELSDCLPPELFDAT